MNIYTLTQGTIPLELGALTDMAVLDVNGNSFSGKQLYEFLCQLCVHCVYMNICSIWDVVLVVLICDVCIIPGRVHS